MYSITEKTMKRRFWNCVALVLLRPHLFCVGSKELENEATDLSSTLSTGRKIPLVGMGVGNLQHELIEGVISSDLKDMEVRLIDTAAASRNERLIAQATSQFRSKTIRTGGGSGDNANDDIHVITKVWYTHLGYERTKISVAESLTKLSEDPKLKVHILLHWPRCNDDIPWMKCEEEEGQLPEYIRNAGPPPHLDKANAWKESWRALEDIYITDQERRSHDNYSSNMPSIESIGVSNFEMEDMQELIRDSRIKPSIYQGNLWIALHNPDLFQLLHDHNILFQAYNVMNGALQRRNQAPNAFSVLSKIAKLVSLKLENKKITEAMVVVAWLAQEGISVIPRSSSNNHQRENSPLSISVMPRLSYENKVQIRDAVSALMRGEDLQVEATFHNRSSGPIMIHWLNPKTGEETPVTSHVHPGTEDTIQTHPGHVFVAYDKERKARNEFRVSAFYGERETFSVGDEL